MSASSSRGSSPRDASSSSEASWPSTAPCRRCSSARARYPPPRRGRDGPRGRPRAPRPADRCDTARASAGREPLARRVLGHSCCSSLTSAACDPLARSASTRASSAARRCSSSRAISAGANGSNASSASGGPRHSSSASRSSTAARSGSPAVERAPPCRYATREALGVELARAHPQPVAGRRGRDRLGIPERLAQPRDVHLHRLDRSRRRVLTPQRHRQAFRAHRLVRVQQQHGQHRARLETSQPHRTAFAAYFKRAEYLKLH